MIVARRLLLDEEFVNAATHGVGALGAMAAWPWLLSTAHEQGGIMAAAHAGVFVATAIFLYLASTIYHAVRAGKLKRKLLIVDRAAIYLLIAGTYTPFTLGVLRGPWGWGLFIAVWCLALLGISQELLAPVRYRFPPLLLYLAMGWVAIVAIGPIIARVPTGGLMLLLAGGCCYTFGTLFFVNDRIPYFHALWHLLVLAGTTFHVFAVLHYAT